MLHFGLPYEFLSREGTLRNSALTWKEAAILSLMWFSSSRKKCERSWTLARTKENAAIIHDYKIPDSKKSLDHFGLAYV